MNNLEWIKLVEFGEYQHQKGLQIVDRGSAEAMIEYFRSLRGKFMRKFLGLPIYIGHPDDPDYSESHDKTVYGRIENMKIEDNALWILSRWTSMGKKIFNNDFLRYLSPRWMMKKIAEKIFLPVRLISVGLTNHPNVRCDHVVNIVDEPAQIEEKCAELVCNEEVVNKVNAKNLAVSEQNIPDSKPEVLEFKDEVASECKNRSENELNSESKEDSKEENKEESTIPLHTSSLTGDLVKRKDELTLKDKILKLVYEHMVLSGDNYQESWMIVKRQNPRLFE